MTSIYTIAGLATVGCGIITIFVTVFGHRNQETPLVDASSLTHTPQSSPTVGKRSNRGSAYFTNADRSIHVTAGKRIRSLIALLVMSLGIGGAIAAIIGMVVILLSTFL